MISPEDALAKVSLFSMLPKRELIKLGRMATDRTFPVDAVLAAEDGDAATFGVIVEGRAAVTVHGQPTRALGPGDYFGEMALIDKSVRSATVTAETDVRCLFIEAWVFRSFAWNHPGTTWALLEAMVQRVREAEAR
jgi:CRP/FNR family transcriptional regulator, cyclic AMP receptor protein